jgi:hypothetical protein
LLVRRQQHIVAPAASQLHHQAQEFNRLLVERGRAIESSNIRRESALAKRVRVDDVDIVVWPERVECLPGGEACAIGKQNSNSFRQARKPDAGLLKTGQLLRNILSPTLLGYPISASLTQRTVADDWVRFSSEPATREFRGNVAFGQNCLADRRQFWHW